jgi:hypothetical protein
VRFRLRLRSDSWVPGACRWWHPMLRSHTDGMAGPAFPSKGRPASHRGSLYGSVGLVVLGALVGGCGLDLAGELTVTDDAGMPPNGQGSPDAGGGKVPAAIADAGDASANPADDASSPASDAGATCAFGGTWATKITIAVNWAPQGIMGVILAPGSGAIQQWILSTRVQNGAATTDTAMVCGIALPDFSGTGFVGGETYGVRFPDSLFDSGDLPPFSIPGLLSDSSPHAAFSTTATAVLLGLTLPAAATAAWPTPVTTEVDSDMDGEPGVSVGVATGPIPGSTTSGVYSNIPVDLMNRTNHLDIVIRQVTRLTGAASDCDHISGTVTIPKISNKFAIDSHVIGCDLVSGATCSTMQSGFVDATQPIFSPSGATAFTSVRMPGATCAMVRQLLP